MFGKKKEGDGLFKSVLLAYFILALHVLLIAAMGVLVLFFRGVVNYMIWIFLAGIALIIFSVYVFYRRMKAQGKTLKEMLRNPMFEGRAVEVSLLGGLASLKLGNPTDTQALTYDKEGETLQLEDPDAMKIREINELGKLLEKKLITLEEFNKAKKHLFKS